MATRAKLRGKPLEDFCQRASTTTHEYGIEDNRVFCYGLVDSIDDYPCDECRKCGAFVMNAEPIKKRLN